MNAFEELYWSQRRRVYSVCLRMTGSTSSAEDLTQDVFVQLFRKLKTFRGEASFSTWLHRLTVNQVLMHFRKLAARPEEATDDDANQIAIQRGTEKPNSISLIDRISLNEAIDQLAPGYRAVFVLHDVAGYEHDQIARILGCAVGTSKSQLHKARMKLRGLLSKRALPKNGGTNEKMLTHKKKTYCAAPC